MSQSLTVELSDEVYAALRRQAQAAKERFEQHFGEVNLGHPTGADHESIDADLAREYSRTHEDT